MLFMLYPSWEILALPKQNKMKQFSHLEWLAPLDMWPRNMQKVGISQQRQMFTHLELFYYN